MLSLQLDGAMYKQQTLFENAHCIQNEPRYEKNWLFAYVKTKPQISCAVTAQLISAFVFATQIVQSLFFLNPKFKPLAIFCSCTVRFVSDLVGNPEYRFSHNEAQIMYAFMQELITQCHVLLILGNMGNFP